MGKTFRLREGQVQSREYREGSGQDNICDPEEAFGMHIHALQSQRLWSLGVTNMHCAAVYTEAYVVLLAFFDRA